MDVFGALPPEINSARMYSGLGSAPLLASAAAWDALAAALDSFGAGYSGAISALQSGSWSGGASNSMAAAAATYIAWVTTTAGHAAATASQTRAAASALDAAFAATVPPRKYWPTGCCWRRSSQRISSGKTHPRSQPPRPRTPKCERRTPPRCTATRCPRHRGHTRAVQRAADNQASRAVRAARCRRPLGHSQTTLSQLMSAVPHRL